MDIDLSHPQILRRAEQLFSGFIRLIRNGFLFRSPAAPSEQKDQDADARQHTGQHGRCAHQENSRRHT